MNNPKIYVGTLKTIENEFEASQKMIKKQDYKNFDSFVFENLPNKQAHATLYGDFLDKKDQYDILIKIDADMVLVDTKVFSDIVALFNKHKKIKFISIMLQDFFTGDKIWGLNSYRNTITAKKQDDIYVDRFIEPEKHEKMFLSDRIAGYHSPNPSNYQAFHFGFHRQLKKQRKIILDIFWAYLRSLNRKRAIALMGAIAVEKNELSADQNISYFDERIEQKLNLIKKKNNLSLFYTIITSISMLYIKLILKQYISKK